MAREFYSGHNFLINLDESQDGTDYYHSIFKFLKKSRIHYVLTYSPVLCEPYLIEFWKNARHLKNPAQEVIQSKVANQSFTFSANDLIDILHLGTVDQEGGENGLTTFD